MGWFGQEGRKVHVGNFLYWRTALELQRSGCGWLDLGGYEASAGYGSFKASMGAVPYELLKRVAGGLRPPQRPPDGVG